MGKYDFAAQVLAPRTIAGFAGEAKLVVDVGALLGVSRP